MGKHEVGTPKYIANKIKAKGLQKLRWYCQMCEKQCRDENGFKCHTMSESHHRQLLLFADNASRYMDQFSREFSQGYLHLLKRQFGTKRVPANRVYQDYIADRGHVHMNATIWLSLTGFVKWLGRTGKCVVDETEKGWFVTYIDRDPETLAAQEKKAKKQKMDKDDEERMMDFIEKQVERGRQDGDSNDAFKVPLVRPEDDKPLVLELKLKPKVTPITGLKTDLTKAKSRASSSIEEESNNTMVIKKEPEDDTISEFSVGRSDTSTRKRDRHDSGDTSSKRLKSEHSDIKKEKRDKESKGWLREGLAVKLTTKSLGDKYYKAKGIIQELIDKQGFVGKIKLTSPSEVEGHIVKLDQAHMETVIPTIGRIVLILWGKYEGEKAIVQKVRIEEFSVDVELEGDKKLVKRIPYEQICKYVGKQS
ncbi:DNA/RNA-binding protein KIN17 [Cephus cinctus]|uniref:DNA/RNA-binding protein KIN17 n=1 Tax=Cephus cinctus TaxID=211228 RepID=A0AAJ7BL57_CEPCN|nr:DNA/RNA-binding protein KIN17 [Cephus cinctus]XP_015588191.1 DNA/RNA-binding protein KIN17 [Cephus cinctus]XP_015588192.1 DNA/RNA-binding protein KIN17 [Cephus cinctus]